MQEQKINSPSVEGDPIDVATQTVNSPVQQTIDGKKIIYLFYPSATNMNWKNFLDVCRYQYWKSRADSTRYHWCIISYSFSLDRTYPRKGTISPHSSYFQTTCYFLPKFFLTHLQTLNSPALSYSFNFEEYIDKDEISSSAISSKEALSE